MQLKLVRTLFIIAVFFPSLCYGAITFTVNTTDVPVFIETDSPKKMTITFSGVNTSRTYAFNYTVSNYSGNAVSNQTNLSLSVDGSTVKCDFSIAETEMGWYKAEVVLLEDGVVVGTTNSKIGSVTGDNTYFTYAILTSPPTQNASSPFGICEHFATRENQALLQRAGIKWQRMDTRSSVIRPNTTAWSWDLIDSYVANMTAYETNYLPLIAYGFSNDSMTTNTTDPTRHLPVIDPYWNDYIDNLTARFNSQYWEVWNEADPACGDVYSSFWENSSTEYMTLLNSTTVRIRASNASALVLHCGAASPIYPNRACFYAELNNHTDDFDFYNIHPYCFPNAPEADIGSGYGSYASWLLHSSIQGKPLWITEFGYPVYDASNNLTNQAQFLVRSIVIFLSEGGEKFFPYELANVGVTDSAATNTTVREDNFGIVYNDNQPKPAYVAYANLIRQLAGKTAFAKNQITATAYRADFTNENNMTTVLWSTGSETVAVPLRSNNIIITDIMGGNVTTMNSLTGVFTFNLTGNPIYATYNRGSSFSTATFTNATFN